MQLNPTVVPPPRRRGPRVAGATSVAVVLSALAACGSPSPPTRATLGTAPVKGVPAAASPFSYLPTGSSVVSSGPLGNATHTVISLPAEPQLAPLPAEIWSAPTPLHLPSVDVVEQPGATIMAPGADQYFDADQGTLGSLQAQWSYPKNGYGPYRVDVTDGTHVWTLTTDNLTNSPTISLATLKLIAAGVAG